MLKALFTEVSEEILTLNAFVYMREGQCHNSTAKTTTDIHLGNILIHLPTSLDKLSVQEFYEQFGEPYTEPVVRLDGQPLPPGVPACRTMPVWLRK